MRAMRRAGSVPRTLGLIGMVLMASASSVAGSPGPAYRVDEAAGVLAVMGEGRPPARVEHPAQARLMAERAAVVAAYAAAARLLSQAIEQAGPGQETYSLFLRGGMITRSEIAPDGSVKVEVAIPLGPELAGRVAEVIRRPSGSSRESEGLSHADFVAQHGIPGPRPVTLSQWLDRYRRGARVPDRQ